MRRATRATRWAGTIRGSVHTLEKAAAGGQQLRSWIRSPDGWCTWRGSPKHLRKQPRCASGAQHRGSRGLCGCIARAGKTTDGPAGHLPRRPRSGRRTRASWPTSARTRTSFKLRKKTTQDAARCADNRRHCRWENPCRQPGVIYNRVHRPEQQVTGSKEDTPGRASESNFGPSDTVCPADQRYVTEGTCSSLKPTNQHITPNPIG